MINGLHFVIIMFHTTYTLKQLGLGDAMLLGITGPHE